MPKRILEAMEETPGNLVFEAIATVQCFGSVKAREEVIVLDCPFVASVTRALHCSAKKTSHDHNCTS